MKNGKNQIRKYIAFFEANEHGGYTVIVPRTSWTRDGRQGEPEHARGMAKDAIRCYIEGLKKAKSRS
jgi:predicted RNase H-like HicB family nuclease